MDLNEFGFLLANANSIAELALYRLAKELDSSPSAMRGEQNVSAEELEARLTAQFESMEFSGLDGINYDSFGAITATPAAASREEAALAVEAIAFGESQFVDTTSVDSYLAQSYASLNSLQVRVERSYAKADLLSFGAALARLPFELAPLTAPLSADDMAGWLDAYQSGHEELCALVTQLRFLDQASIGESLSWYGGDVVP